MFQVSLEHSRPSELRRFSFDCYCEEGINADKLFCQMAENVPNSLETIIIKMDYDNPWIFSTDSLRKFFEEWCCKGEGGNKKPRRLRIKRSLKSNNSSFSPLNMIAISS